jgi:hypothetical protein
VAGHAEPGYVPRDVRRWRTARVRAPDVTHDDLSVSRTVDAGFDRPGVQPTALLARSGSTKRLGPFGDAMAAAVAGRCARTTCGAKCRCGACTSHRPVRSRRMHLTCAQRHSCDGLWTNDNRLASAGGSLLRTLRPAA